MPSWSKRPRAERERPWPLWGHQSFHPFSVGDFTHTCAHTHMYTRTHGTHVYRHTCAHVCTHRHTRVHIRTHMHTRVHTWHTCTHSRTHVHICVYTRHTCTHTDTQIYTRVYTQRPTYTHTAQVHMETHVYTHVYTHMAHREGLLNWFKSNSRKPLHPGWDDLCPTREHRALSSWGVDMNPG